MRPKRPWESGERVAFRPRGTMLWRLLIENTSLKSHDAQRIKLKLFEAEYAGQARSGDRVPQAICFTHCATSMLFRKGALRTSCGRALKIFPGAMTDNILVIGARERPSASEFAGLSAKRIVFT
ncbi:hypothetical protein [Bradyrhizobium japonicum]|uniref:hypothetical protein n=1 Tax=Bradyrhizobium japonicum TaxID=375 RepID=UPI001BA9BD42|nr:hypothetical protein [Bradyrhizobium japonicum]